MCVGGVGGNRLFLEPLGSPAVCCLPMLAVCVFFSMRGQLCRQVLEGSSKGVCVCLHAHVCRFKPRAGSAD